MPKNKTRSKNLNDEIIEDIVRQLDGWTGKLTWELLIAAIAQRTRSTYTRQALHQHERIKRAYQLRKQALSATGYKQPRSADKLSPSEVETLLQRVQRLSAENTRLKAENERLLEQFAIWAYNAHSRGLDLDFLSRPLPRVDREQTRVATLAPNTTKR
ncbi:hypothetical protein [Pseudogulbenkiania ferrooxidans]|uniref:hypothetical protein n=1 Tax=Pseudogulbenkiania ferrooxidans TaxID=549169 RepID=UPI0009D67554|nr:hypothetical protein [Pseudogulbenkiania ferrooxidans]